MHKGACNARILCRPHRSFLLCLILCAVITQIGLFVRSSVLVVLMNAAGPADATATGNARLYKKVVSTDSTGSTSTSTSTASSTNNTTTSGIANIQQGPIFYNLFVPNDDNNHSAETKMNRRRRETERIVKEQLVQRKLTSPNATIRYTLIGDASFQDFVSTQCQDPHSCQLDQVLPVGDETHTLQSLWEYCQQQQSSSADASSDVLVTYIHDKGSFHPTEANEKARRMATKAAMECRHILPHKTRVCNICMGAFHIFPQYLASAK